MEAKNDSAAGSGSGECAIDEDNATGVAFVVGDVETAPDSLSATASSSNEALIAPSGIVLGGSGINRAIANNPIENASGVTIVLGSVDGVAIWVEGVPPSPGIGRRQIEAPFPGSILTDEITDDGWWTGGQATAAHGRGRAIAVAAQLRQRQPRHQRLDQEQQETAREDDEREQGAPGSLARDRRHVLVHRIPIE